MLHRFTVVLIVLLAMGAGTAIAAPAPALAHPADSVIDDDHDAVNNFDDNCRYAYNPSQSDFDRDSVGDACDTDLDGDGVDNAADNCTHAPNSAQGDLDGDGRGDACDSDDDSDDVPDARDNCPRKGNPDQKDTDGDGLGDACDSTPGTSSPAPATKPESSPGPSSGGSSPASSGQPDRPAEPPSRSGAPDSRSPSVVLGRLGTHSLDELESGLAVPVRCSEGCKLTVTLLLPSKVARRLRLGSGRAAGGMTVLGRDQGVVDAAAGTFLFIELGSRTLARMAKVRSLRPVLRVEAVDAAGNRGTAERRIKLVRR